MIRIWSVGMLTTTALVTSTAAARDLNALYGRAQFTVGAAKVDAYVADDDQRRAQGLMNVESLKANEGMLFVFEDSRRLSFWMKNTLIPLAIGFFDHRCRLTEVIEMDVASSVLTTDVPTYQSRESARFALEMNRRWYAKNGVKVGARLSLRGAPASPTLRDALAECK